MGALLLVAIVAVLCTQLPNRQTKKQMSDTVISKTTNYEKIIATWPQWPQWAINMYTIVDDALTPIRKEWSVWTAILDSIFHPYLNMIAMKMHDFEQIMKQINPLTPRKYSTKFADHSNSMRKQRAKFLDLNEELMAMLLKVRTESASQTDLGNIVNKNDSVIDSLSFLQTLLRTRNKEFETLQNILFDSQNGESMIKNK